METILSSSGGTAKRTASFIDILTMWFWQGFQLIYSLFTYMLHKTPENLMSSLQVAATDLRNGFGRNYELAPRCKDGHAVLIPMRGAALFQVMNGWWGIGMGKVEQGVEDMESVFGIPLSEPRNDIGRDDEGFARNRNAKMVSPPCDMRAQSTHGWARVGCRGEAKRFSDAIGVCVVHGPS